MKILKILMISLFAMILLNCEDHKPHKNLTDLNLPPVVQITSPAFNTAYVPGSDIYFEANYFSLEDNSENWTATWESDLDGVLFIENLVNTKISRFTTSVLSDSVHTITVSFNNPDLDQPVVKYVIVENYLPADLDYTQFIYLGTFQHSQYFFSNFCVDWTEADSLCILHNGHQVTITSESEDEFLDESMRQYWSARRDSAWVGTAWLGLYYNEASSTHDWVTGEEFDYYSEDDHPYEEDFPDNPNSNTPYVYMRRYGNAWRYSDNSVQQRFVLELELGEDEKHE